MNDPSPAHFRGMPQWAILGIIFAALVLGSLSIGLAWKQSTDASANLAFGERDTEVIRAISKLVTGTSNEALVVHTLNAMVNLKSITNYQSLGVLAIGAGAAFLAIGFALFLIGADGAFKIQYEGKADNKIAFYATAPGLLCFVLSAALIGLGATRKHEMSQGDYQSSGQAGDTLVESPQRPLIDPSKSAMTIAPDILARICFDRILPRDLLSARSMSGWVKVGGGRVRAISPIGKTWMNGSTLRVRFLDGDSELQRRVKEYAVEWSNYANIRLDFGTSANAEIRVSFNGVGRWSYIGTDARGIPLGEATMNLGGFDKDTPVSELRRVVLHQFGHALGLAHEHHVSAGGMQWNESVVIQSLAGPPNYWTEAQTRHHLFRKYDANQINGTQFDPDSIMLYFFPDSWTLNGTGTEANEVLSEMDKAFIAGPKMYPKAEGTTSNAVELLVNAKHRTQASIGKVGEEDLYRFTATTDGRYVIDILGQTNVVMKLFGPNSQSVLITEDDASRPDTNARIEVDLISGEYFVQIHSRQSGTGKYSIKVRKL